MIKLLYLNLICGVTLMCDRLCDRLWGQTYGVVMVLNSVLVSASGRVPEPVCGTTTGFGTESDTELTESHVGVKTDIKAGEVKQEYHDKVSHYQHHMG